MLWIALFARQAKNFINNKWHNFKQWLAAEKWPKIYIVYISCILPLLVPAVLLPIALLKPGEADAGDVGDMRYMSVDLGIMHIGAVTGPAYSIHSSSNPYPTPTPTPTPSPTPTPAPTATPTLTPTPTPTPACALHESAAAPTLHAFYSSEVSPFDFFIYIGCEYEIAAAFTIAPDMGLPDLQDIGIALSCGHGNRVNLESELFIIELIQEMHIEAEVGKKPHEMFDALSFIANYSETLDITYTLPVLGHLEITGYTITFNTDGYTAHSTLLVLDTTPPTAGVANRRAYLGKPIPATNFVYDIHDYSPVTVSYVLEPDFSQLGTQEVSLLLEDAFSNQTFYTAQLTVVHDTTPPVISGQLNRELLAGGTASYRTGVNVTDDYDPSPTLTVDSSQVNLNQPGTYEVIYTARDASGNTSQATGTVTVTGLTMDYVNRLADGILAEIVNGSMTQREKAYEIFIWVNRKVSYSSGNHPRDIINGAYACFSRGVGDCYVYMSGAQVLLNRAGIDNVTVKRLGGTSEHYWLLVNTGDGWYHFDATGNLTIPRSELFMFTDTQAAEFTRRIGAGREFFTYDKSTVPEVVQ